ncbi:MAG: site-specific integrase [Desulfamplus sp.]|nr:site-specific integrase [Desulfamplus sp.]
MPKVYTGKVAIPGDKIDEYFKLMQQAIDARKPFKDSFTKLNDEFYDYLATKYSERTASKHSSIISMFIEFISGHTDVENIEEITKGMANTQFKQWYKRKVWDSSTTDDLRVAIDKFFKFLSKEKNIVNEKVLGIKKKTGR